jgi:hypothetical protein
MAIKLGFFGIKSIEGTEFELSEVTFSATTGRTFPACVKHGSLILKNTGDEVLYLSCPMTSNAGFTWGALSNNPLRPNESVPLLIESTDNTEVAGIVLSVFISKQPITSSNLGTPKQLIINRRLPLDANTFTSSFSIRLNANPPGDDLDPSGGEYVELKKIGNALINLQYCQINHLVFSASQISHPTSQRAFTFESILTPQQDEVIRIYTRPEHVDDKINNPEVDTFFYLNKKQPIWNNRAPERAIVLNQQLEVMQVFPSPVVIPPPSSSGSTTSNTIVIDNLLLACNRWNLVASIQEGDTIKISGPGSQPNVQGSYRWFNVILNTRTRDADGYEFGWGTHWFEIAPPYREEFGYFPIPYQNKWALIGLLSNTARLDLNLNYMFNPDAPDGEFVYIGTYREFSVVQSGNSPLDFTRPIFLYLGVNDNKFDDNSGFLHCKVTVF